MYTLVAVGLLATAALVAGLMFWFGRPTRRLLAPPHLVEVARLFGLLKKAALAMPLSSPAAFAPLPNDPRVMATSQGLLVYYTVCSDNSCHAHHLSLTVIGGRVPRVAGETLVLYLAHLLAIPCDRLDLSVSPSTVHHAQFVLNKAEQIDLDRRPVKAPTAAKLVELQRSWKLLRTTINWRPLQPC